MKSVKEIELLIKKEEAGLEFLKDAPEFVEEFKESKEKIFNLNIKLEKAYAVEKKKEDKRLKEELMSQNDLALKVATEEVAKGVIGLDSPFEYFYDQEVKKYIEMLKSNGHFMYFEKDEIKEQIEEEYGLNPKQAENLRKKLPKALMDFDPQEELNFFNASKHKNIKNMYRPTYYLTRTKTCNNDLDNTMSLIKKLAPHINFLLENLFYNDFEMRKHFINWFATILQTKGKMLTSFIIQGEQGGGKGVLTLLIKLIFGKEYVSEPVSDAVFGKFNASWALRKMFVIMNEIEHDEKSAGKKNYGKLKSYITDDTIEIEEKNIKKMTIKNSFNCLFFSNKNAIQIETSDRRYNVAETGSDIKIKVEKELKISMDDFIELLKKELDEFVQILYNLDYDLKKANSVLENTFKKSIVNATETSLNKVCHALKKHDIKTLRELVIDSVDSIEVMDVVLENIKNNMKDNIIFNGHCKWLLEHALGEDNISDAKVGKLFNSNLKTETNSKKIKGKTIRFKYIDFQKELIRREKEGK